MAGRIRGEIIGGKLLTGEAVGWLLLLLLGLRAEHGQRGKVRGQGEAVKASRADAPLERVWQLLRRGHGVRLHTA